MKRAQKVKLSLFREDPDNVSVATDEEIQRLAGKLKRVPLGLTAMRIAYVTDAPGGGRMVISGNKRLRCLKAAYGEGVKMLVEAAALIERGKSAALWTPQDERFATWEPSWNRPRLQRPDLLMIDYK